MNSRIIGNYQIAGVLAHGGMGAVYRARHLHLPREVVIKSILLDSFSPSAQEQLKARFRREACIQAQLDHQNIVRVYEFFETADNYYLVMEYVPGMSLRELLDKQGVPTPAQAVYLFKQVLSALDYAHNFTYVDEVNHHRRGIIHRDINPSNLLLDKKGRVKITDFGTVKMVGASRLTQSGFHPGTIEYMSPEQLRGGEIDARSDIYSLGVAFYEMLTGQVPFPQPKDGSDWDVRKGHIELQPPALLKLNPEIPSKLASIVMRALQKDPAARYQSGAEFLAALQVFTQHSPNVWRLHGRKLHEKPVRLDAVARTAATTVTAALPGQSFDGSFTLSTPATAADCDDVNHTWADPSLRPPSTHRPTVGNHSAEMVTGSVGVSRAQPVISKYNRAFLAAFLLLFLAGLTTGAGYVLVNGGENTLHAVMTRIGNWSSASERLPTGRESLGERVTGPAKLSQAAEFEKRESYDEAIEAYEDYLRQNPDVRDVGGLNAKLIEIKRLQVLITAAQLAAKANRLTDAKRYYDEALLLRPDSQAVQTGLAEIERSLAAQQSNPK